MTQTKHSILMQAEMLTRQKHVRFASSKFKKFNDIEKIFFIGTGTSFHCASWGKWFFEEKNYGLNLDAKVVSSWDFLAEFNERNTRVRAKRARTLYVVISHRGCRGITAEVLRVLKNDRVVLIKAVGAPDGGFNHFNASVQEKSEAHTESLMGAISCIAELACLITRSSRTRRLITQARTVVAETLKDVTPLFFKQPTPKKMGTVAYYTLGAGAFYPIAMEASLKLIEMAHRTSRPFQLEEFLHGPFAGIKKGDVLIALLPFSHRATGLSAKLYNNRTEAAVKGAKLLGAQVFAPKLPSRLKSRVAKLPYSWQALIALYWGQVFALKCADSLKINPDCAHRDDPRYDRAFKLAAWK